MIRTLIAFLFPISLTLADESTRDSTANKYMDSSIFRIATEQPYSIQHDDGEKLYLNPKNIHRAYGGHLLHSGHSFIFLPRLSFDYQGVYLARRSKDDLRLKCTNRKCGYVWWFSEEWSIYCPRCGAIGVDEE